MKGVSLNNGRALHPPNIAATLRVSESIATSAQQTGATTENRLRKLPIERQRCTRAMEKLRSGITTPQMAGQSLSATC